MRTRLVVPLLLLLAATAPSASGVAGNPEGIRVLEDPSGDVAITNPSGMPVPVSGEQFASIDILAADVGEQEDGFAFTVWVAGFPPPSPTDIFSGGQVRLFFRHVDVAYAVEYNTFSTFRGASLLADPALAGEYDYLADLDLTLDEPAGRMTAFVPRQYLGDRDGAPPFPGRALEGFHADSQGAGMGGNININDVEVGNVQAGDEAASAEGFALPVLLGVRQDGAARLAATRPFRASNGEAATFIFEVEATHLGEDEALYRLEAKNVPQGWQVTFPQTQLRLEPEESRSVPVLATVPFAHQHGRLASFLVELQDLSDAASTGRVELGLHYTSPPQPAGHHDALYLHSAGPNQFEQVLGTVFNFFSSERLTMNTLEEDPADDAVGIPGQFSNIEGLQRVSFQWDIPLSPRLQMGIDSDLSRSGTLHIPVGTTLPMPAARLDGYLYVVSYTYDEDGDVDGVAETILAQVVPTAEADVGAGASTAYDTVLVPDKAGDYIPYDPEANLYLVLNLSFARPAGFTSAEAPVVQPGGHLRLPLLEYADPVDDLFTGELGLSLDPWGGAERRAPPGGATIFTLNATGPAGRYTLLAHGPEAAWVEFPDGDLSIDGDGLGRMRIVVRVPGNVTNGTVVDLVVEAAGGPADAVRSLVRLRVTIDPDAPDEGATLGSTAEKGSPGVGLALLLVALLAAAGVDRRRWL